MMMLVTGWQPSISQVRSTNSRISMEDADDEDSTSSNSTRRALLPLDLFVLLSSPLRFRCDDEEEVDEVARLRSFLSFFRSFFRAFFSLLCCSRRANSACNDAFNEDVAELGAEVKVDMGGVVVDKGAEDDGSTEVEENAGSDTTLGAAAGD